jgi:NTE family protein
MRPSHVVGVLSGGGAKAAAHIGALRALDERRLTATHYVATSMGAVVGACFACGLGYDEVLKRILSISRGHVAKPSPTLLLGPLAKSFLSAERFRETIATLVPARAFSELETPLTVTAVDVGTGELVLFGAGGRRTPLLDALLASCSLPLYFPPVEIAGRSYADGGLRAVLPLDVAAVFDPDLLFAVRVGPTFSAEPPERSSWAPPLIRAHNSAMRILMAAQTDATIARWRDGPIPLVLVEPQVEQEATFAVDKVVGYVEEGYRAACRALDTSSELALHQTERRALERGGAERPDSE